MIKLNKIITSTIATAVLWCLLGIGVQAAPYINKSANFVQPDGSKIPVKVTGDEYYQDVESTDGYALCRDKNGWICYAKLNTDGTDYVSTGKVYRKSDNIYDDAKITIPKHLKLKKTAIEQKSAVVKKKLHAAQYDAPTSPIAKNSYGILDSKVASTPQNVKGLAVLVDFPDTKSSISKSDIEQFFNGVGYTGYNNNGSVRDYYYDVSGGKLTYTNNVIGFYTAKHPKSYYDDINEATGSYAKSEELSNEVFQWLKTSGFDMSTLTTDSNGYVKAVNILYAGSADAGWAKGLWPHQDWYSGSDSINGVKIQKYEISDIENDLSIFTICHESGHMIYGYPDLYDYNGKSQGTGIYSLMSGTSNEKNPAPPDPYCRNIISGWNTPISMNAYGSGTKFDAVFNETGNQYSYKWSGKNSNEYYLIENIQKKGRYADEPDAGLAIWHVDQNGSNCNSAMTPSSHYLVSLEQADGKFDLEKNVNAGDSGDLFRAGYKDTFNNNTTPSSKWWDGTASGLNISGISQLGDEMTFVQSSSGTSTQVNKGTNISGQATPSASYCSPWENVSALNDGKDPTSSSDRSGAVYGNWPKTGTQWVQYHFNKNFTISSCDVYWFKDGKGIDVPVSYKIFYWDGAAWQEVKNAKGLGTEVNKYNTTTFTTVSTNDIVIQMEPNGSNSTGILEWKVYGK